MKKRFIYILSFIFVFFILSFDVQAITVYTQDIDGGHNICYDSNLNFAQMAPKRDPRCKPLGYGSTLIKRLSDGRRAYCGAKDRQTRTRGDGAYKLDTSWARATNCRYRLKNPSTGVLEAKTGGACSEILGFIIDEARKSTYAGKATDTESRKIMRAQGAVWTYLAAFTDSPYKNGNGTPKGGWDANATIKKILVNAWDNYYKTINTTGSNVDETVVQNNMISISPTDVTLYYVPQDTCGKGNYKSGNIKITNNMNKDIVVNLSHSIIGLNICDDHDGCKKSKSINITKNSTYTFYLEDNTAPTSGEDLRISVYATYKEDTNRTVTADMHDSDRYIIGNDSDSQNLQSMFAEKKSEINANKKIKRTYYTEQNIRVSYKSVKGNTCPSSQYPYGGNDNSYYKERYWESTQKKICANNLTDSQINARKADYTADYSGCTCGAFTLNGKKVRIIIKENTEFVFGTFSPSYVYPGGGFGLASSDPSVKEKVPKEGLFTKYTSYLTWQFADTNDGKPYYYNTVSKTGEDASGLTNDIQKAIEEKIDSRLGRDERIELPVDTINSDNKSDKASDYAIDLNLKNSEAGGTSNLKGIRYDADKKQFSKVYYVHLREAYFASNGKVVYKKGVKGYDDAGGYLYYVPVNFTNATNTEQRFRFNIVNANLSLSGYFRFIYNADCYEIVKPYDLTGNLNYRSIAEDNPFPTYIAANWITWYDNPLNKTRLASSFSKYPDNPLYRVSFKNEDLGKIADVGTNYTDWRNIKEDGSSAYVGSNGFIQHSNGSYCPIGVFDKSCDQYQ